ncbi:F-box WD repeat-containing 7 isoform X2 [Brachionus plicatilis]|uniref:F-box WD repeat-containing 7 isoform X2 n=1 Tax=Brachionus plicatilis TaxID=10195 RepID=A0A3M7SMR3_BRAPC|nr:F-box WD repeat-containing 7 isoform X2 [Brachionus plicatilis]
MDNLEIILPGCCLSTAYQKIKDQPSKFVCVECGDHTVDKADCLNIKRNQIAFRQKQLEIELSNYGDLNGKLDHLVQNAQHHFEQGLQDLTNSLDLRREYLKKSVDDFFFELLEKLTQEKDQMIAKVNEPSFLKKKSVDFSMHKSNSLEILDKNLDQIKKEMHILQEKIEFFDFGKNYELVVPESPLNVKEIFGFIQKDQKSRENETRTEIKYERIKNFNHCDQAQTKFITLPDIKFLSNKNVLSSNMHQIKLWNDESNICLKQLNTQNVKCLCVLNKSLVACGYLDSKIRIWSLDSYSSFLNFRPTAARQLCGHTDQIECLKLLKNGYLASGSRDGLVKIWDYNVCACVRTLKSHSGGVYCLEEMVNGNLLSGSMDGKIRFWDAQSGFNLHILDTHSSLINGLVVLDSGLLVSSSSDCVKVWNLETKNNVHKFEINSITCIDKLSNNFLVVGLWFGKVEIWDVESERCVQRLNTDEEGVGKLAVNQNDDIAVIAVKNCNIQMWKKSKVVIS